MARAGTSGHRDASTTPVVPRGSALRVALGDPPEPAVGLRGQRSCFGRGATPTTSGEWKQHPLRQQDGAVTSHEIHGLRDANATLDEQLARSLRLVAPAIAAIHVIALLDPGAAAAWSRSAAAATLAFAVLGLLTVLRPVPTRLANPLLVGGLGVIAVEALVRGEAAAPNLALALVGAGAVALRPRWAIASAGAVLGPWLAAAVTGLWGWRVDDPVAAELAAAATLAVVVFEARHGSVAGLITARSTLHALALTDPLTGLLNRRGIEEEAARMLATAGAELSIVYLDLDDFKAVNDRLGHAEGDRALQAMAGILLQTFRAADAVGRIGGDEFAVIVAPGSDAAAAARRLESGLRRWRDPERRYELRASLGVGQLAGNTLDAFWEAVDAADQRMYRAKEARRRSAGALPAGAPAIVPVPT
jgi:diguanylate cyclase (GGDEF)-like protein